MANNGLNSVLPLFVYLLEIFCWLSKNWFHEHRVNFSINVRFNKLCHENSFSLRVFFFFKKMMRVQGCKTFAWVQTWILFIWLVSFGAKLDYNLSDVWDLRKNIYHYPWDYYQIFFKLITILFNTCSEIFIHSSLMSFFLFCLAGSVINHNILCGPPG